MTGLFFIAQEVAEITEIVYYYDFKKGIGVSLLHRWAILNNKIAKKEILFHFLPAQFFFRKQLTLQINRKKVSAASKKGRKVAAVPSKCTEKSVLFCSDFLLDFSYSTCQHVVCTRTY